MKNSIRAIRNHDCCVDLLWCVCVCFDSVGVVNAAVGHAPFAYYMITLLSPMAYSINDNIMQMKCDNSIFDFKRLWFSVAASCQRFLRWLSISLLSSVFILCNTL